MNCPAWSDGKHLHVATPRSFMPEGTVAYFPAGIATTVEEKVCACGDVVGAIVGGWFVLAHDSRVEAATYTPEAQQLERIATALERINDTLRGNGRNR